MESSVTTKKGDSGQTRALDGAAYGKDHVLMEAVGALDALRAQTALLRVQLQEQQPEALEEIGFLLYVLHSYFLIGSAISDPHNQKMEWRRGQLNPGHLQRLEAEQARLEAALRLPRAFIVCAVNALAAQADITAATTRTFERRLVAFAKAMPDFDAATMLAYVNRLSDFFFILARHLENGRHQPVNYELLDGA